MAEEYANQAADISNSCEMQFVQVPKTPRMLEKSAIAPDPLSSPFSILSKHAPTIQAKAYSSPYMAKGPISRLFYGDMTLISELRKHGLMVDLPLTFRTVDDLVAHLGVWMAKHGGDGPPGSTKYQKSYIEQKIDFKQALYFATTSQQVHLARFKISEEFMGWVMTDSDDSAMYVAAASGNSGNYRGYYGWLGDDKGFSEETMAATRGVRSTADLDVPALARTHKSNHAEDRFRSILPKTGPNCVNYGIQNESGCSHLPSPQSMSGRNSSSSLAGLEELETLQAPTLTRPPTGQSHAMSPRKRKAETGPLEAILFDKKKSEIVSHQPATASAISYHFFTSNTSLGGIPAKYVSCNTFKKFFDQAMSAMEIAGPRVRERNILGVKVEIDSLQWPLLVPWRDQAAYNGMVEHLNAIPTLGAGVVNVKVNGLLKEGA